ncbi:MAG TPA: NADH-quinone oxidoreductase subunit D [Candidatus Margulisiibacteriota bacterium]|nr:NADH-quinone oxidoreductase subunit D [Candidatus Margulisiibacteriota bacterium]
MSQDILERLRERFPTDVLAIDRYRGDASATVRPESLLEVARFAKDDPTLRFDMPLDVTAVDYIGQEPRFEVVHHLYSTKHHHRLRLKARVPEKDPTIPSVTPVWVGANWLERETYDMYGIRFSGHPDLRRIYLYDEFDGHPLRKDYPKEKRQPLIGPGSRRGASVGDEHPYAADLPAPVHDKGMLGSELMRVQLGPSHPATHGTVRIVVDLDGETIVNADVQVGYLHRGFEKECESGFYYQAIPYTDRLNYSSAILCNIGYCMAVEKLFGIETPPRCQFLRVIAGEIARIADHLLCVGATALELNAFTPFLYGLQARELIWDLVDALCGGRVTSNYVRIGGVSADMPAGFAELARQNIAKALHLLGEMEALLTDNPIFRARMEGVGQLPAEELIAYGVCGPLLRAAGVDLDLRRAQPYLVYDQLEFDVPLGSQGDNMDRYLVRTAELRQSARIIEQCLRMIPDGPVDTDDPAIRWPAKSRVYMRMEELIDQFKQVTEGPKPPPGEVYVGTESANGEIGFFLVSDGTGKPYKCRARTPSFSNTQPLARMVQGRLLADMVPTFDMINMIGGECDR